MKITLRHLYLNSFAVQRRQRKQKPVHCHDIPQCFIVKLVCRAPRPEESSQRVERLHVNETDNLMTRTQLQRHSSMHLHYHHRAG
jgi:hypothetical protein